MAGTDIVNRKPRRTKGTPSYYIRNRIAAGCIAVSCIIFGIFSLTPIYRVGNKNIIKDLQPTEEELDRKALFTPFGQRRGEEILRLMKEQDDLLKER